MDVKKTIYKVQNNFLKKRTRNINFCTMLNGDYREIHEKTSASFGIGGIVNDLVHETANGNDVTVEIVNEVLGFVNETLEVAS